MDGEHTEVLSRRYVGMRTACVCTHTCVCLCVRCMCEHVCAMRGVCVCAGRVGVCMGYKCVVWGTGGMCAFVFLVIPFMISLLLGSSMVTQSLGAAGLQVQDVAEVASVQNGFKRSRTFLLPGQKESWQLSAPFCPQPSIEALETSVESGLGSSSIGGLTGLFSVGTGGRQLPPPTGSLRP